MLMWTLRGETSWRCQINIDDNTTVGSGRDGWMLIRVVKNRKFVIVCICARCERRRRRRRQFNTSPPFDVDILYLKFVCDRCYNQGMLWIPADGAHYRTHAGRQCRRQRQECENLYEQNTVRLHRWLSFATNQHFLPSPLVFAKRLAYVFWFRLLL